MFDVSIVTLAHAHNSSLVFLLLMRHMFCPNRVFPQTASERKLHLRLNPSFPGLRYRQSLTQTFITLL